MHTSKVSAFFALLALAFCATPALAQYDDVYFDAAQEDFVYSPYQEEEYTEYDEPAPRRGYEGTDAASDYEYASRIRRFRRPVGSFGYYDPYYVDAGYYDPYWRNGFSTTLIYNTPAVGYQRVYTPYGPRVVAFNRSGFGNPYGFGRFNRFNDPFFAGGFNQPFGGGFGPYAGFNRFGYGGFGGGAFGGGGFGGAYYCPPAFGGVAYNVPNSTNNLTNRATTRQPRGNTTSISDRINRGAYNTPSRDVYTGGEKAATRGRSGRAATATRARNAPTTTRSTGRSRIDQSRTTVRRPTATRSTTVPRTRVATPRTRSTTPRTRSYTPSRSTRSYTPSRSTSPTRTRSYTPSRSTRSYSPSRSSSSSRSTSPSRSSSGRSSSSRGRGGR